MLFFCAKNLDYDLIMFDKPIIKILYFWYGNIRN